MGQLIRGFESHSSRSRAIGARHTELVVVGIGHVYPIVRALEGVDTSCPERHEAVDLDSLIVVVRWSDVEVKPVPSETSGEPVDPR